MFTLSSNNEQVISDLPIQAVMTNVEGNNNI